MKIVLASSSIIAVTTFEKIINNFKVVAIITQPNKKQGRGLKEKETPISLLANKYNIKIFKPVKIISIYSQLKLLNFDLFLTFAFGKWIPTKILQLGNKKPLNIHGSLLPKYRGAAPIHWAILNGEKEIGITLIEMVKNMDEGDIAFQASQKISSQTNTGQAFKIIENLVLKNIVNWLNLIIKNKIFFKKQGINFSFAPKINKSFALLDLSLNINKAIRKIRGLNPHPGAYIFLNQKRVKIFEISLHNIKNSIPLKFKDNYLYATDYQYESKKRQNILKK